MTLREQLQDILNDIAQELAIEDIEEGRTEIDSYKEFIEELELEFRHELENAFECYTTKFEDESLDYQASKLHYENCYLELEYYEALTENNEFYKQQLDCAITEICNMYNIPKQEYLNGSYEFEYDEYDEFLLDLVNTIAEKYGIDNHLGY